MNQRTTNDKVLMVEVSAMVHPNSEWSSDRPKSSAYIKVGEGTKRYNQADIEKLTYDIMVLSEKLEPYDQ